MEIPKEFQDIGFYVVQIPQELAKKSLEEAKSQNRSLNNYINFLLEKELKEHSR